MTDIEHLPLRRAKEIIVAQLAPEKVVVLRVAKATPDPVEYSFGKYIDGFAGATSGQFGQLAAQNLLLPRIGTQNLAPNSYVLHQRLSVSGIAGVQDLVQITQEGEAFQYFIGIAPRDVRVWLEQPYGHYVAGFGQNLNPFENTQLVDFGYVDGYMSPFHHPSPATETLVLDGLTIAYSLVNMLTTFPRAPKFNIILNRMVLEPVTEVAELANILAPGSRIGHRSIGNPFDDLASNFTQNTYGNPPILPPIATEAEIQAIIDKRKRKANGGAA
jgi:hypothetical protein